MKSAATGLIVMFAMLAGCRGAPDPRVWASSVLFLQRESAIDVDTTGIPAAGREQLRVSGVRLDSTVDAERTVRFHDVRATGGGSYEVDVEIREAGDTRDLRLSLECGSRHCLVVDTARI